MRVTISWRDGAYYVDKPNFHGGQVITVEAIKRHLDLANAGLRLYKPHDAERLRQMGYIQALVSILDENP